MDMIGKELKIIKSGKVYGVLIDGVDKIIDFCEQETQNFKSEEIRAEYGSKFDSGCVKEIISQTESKLETYFKRKLKSEKRKWAEDESVKMFGKNLKSLLLTKPIRIKDKSRLVFQLEPGINLENSSNFFEI